MQGSVGTNSAEMITRTLLHYCGERGPSNNNVLDFEPSQTVPTLTFSASLFLQHQHRDVYNFTMISDLYQLLERTLSICFGVYEL